MAKTWAVIFDLDGVLIDSAEFHRESWYLLAGEESFAMTDQLFKETFGLPNWVILPRALEREVGPEEIERLSWRKEALYREAAKGKLQPLPGVLSLLHGLKERCARLAIGSSTPKENIAFVLDELRLHGVFDAVVSSDDVTKGKPDPEVFLTAADRLGVLPDHCAVIEDAVAGVEAAKAGGMKCIAVTTTHPAKSLSPADLVVDSLEQVTAEAVEMLVGMTG